MQIVNVISVILGVGGIGSLAFTVYNSYKNPQIKLETADGLTNAAIVQLGKDLANLRDNHVHSLDLKTDEIQKGVNQLALEVTRLSTIIEERIPKRTS